MIAGTLGPLMIRCNVPPSEAGGSLPVSNGVFLYVSCCGAPGALFVCARRVGVCCAAERPGWM